MVHQSYKQVKELVVLFGHNGHGIGVYIGSNLEQMFDIIKK